MVSYGDIRAHPARARAIEALGVHRYLAVPNEMQVYLDNGAFFFLNRGGEIPRKDYEGFVALARPDWWPIPQDFIPAPAMSDEDQRNCFRRTMAVNREYEHGGYVPGIHAGRMLESYISEFQSCERLLAKPALALGGIVPNLLRAPKAIPYAVVLAGLHRARTAFSGKSLHLFGVGGTATLHLAALLGFDSIDSSGWRNRAARGIVQLPGSGDRTVANLGNWRGREPSTEEWERLEACKCPACEQFGLDGLKASALAGFCNRSTHNLRILLEEARAIETRLADGTYASWYEGHLDNSIYLSLIRQALALREGSSHPGRTSQSGRNSPGSTGRPLRLSARPQPAAPPCEGHTPEERSCGSENPHGDSRR